MLYFDEIDALIDGSGILVENGTITSDNSLIPMYSLGKKFAFTPIPNGPQKSTMNLNYIWEVNFNPNNKIINNIKNSFQNFNSSPFKISLCGLTGLAYLDSYNIKIAPNDIGKVSSSYSVYTPFSGNFSAKQTGYFIEIQLTGLPPSGNRIKVNNGDQITATTIPVGSVDWGISTLPNTIQNLWHNTIGANIFGFDQLLASKWNINGIKSYQINSGIRFIKLGGYAPLVISGNWYQITSGSAPYNTYFTGDITGLAHGWVLYSNTSNNVVSSPHFDFQYDLKVNWSPIYSLGSKIPTQVQLLGAEETFSVTQDIYKNITFTGEDADSIFDFDNSDNLIKAYSLLSLNNDDISYNFDLSGAKVISNSLNAVTDDIVRVNTIAKKYY